MTFRARSQFLFAAPWVGTEHLHGPFDPLPVTAFPGWGRAPIPLMPAARNRTLHTACTWRCLACPSTAASLSNRNLKTESQNQVFLGFPIRFSLDKPSQG